MKSLQSEHLNQERHTQFVNVLFQFIISPLEHHPVNSLLLANKYRVLPSEYVLVFQCNHEKADGDAVKECFVLMFWVGILCAQN